MVRPEVEGFVLAGGASRRMGTDKARLRLPDGRTMAEAVAQALGAVCGRVRLVRHDPEPAWGALEVVADLPGPRHALLGVATALAASSTPLVLVAPCDLPWVAVEDLRRLLAVGGPAVATGAHGVQPLLGVYGRQDLDAVLDAVNAGLPARRLVVGRPVVMVSEASLRNVNTPSDLDALRADPDAIG